MANPVMRLGHASGNITTVGFAMEPGHEELATLRDANHEDLSQHSRTMRNWLLSLPEGQAQYWTHIMQVDHLWPNHGDAPPAWVSCPDHPELERAVADHFSVRGHQVKIGEPEDYVMGYWVPSGEAE